MSLSLVCRFKLLLVCCRGGGALFTDIFALGLWLLESAKESDRLPQTSLAFLDFSATGEWHPARPVAVVGASALHPEVAWSSHCCWSAVGGRVAAGGLVAVVVPVCGVGVWAVLLEASANSQPPKKLRAKNVLGRGAFHASGPSITTRPRGNGCAGRQRFLVVQSLN